MSTAIRIGTIVWLGNRVVELIAGFGEFMVFLARTARWMFGAPARKTVVANMYQVGVRSVPVIAITGTFIGMVLAVQAYAQFKVMGLETRLGSVINVSLLSELGPVLAATMLAGRVGSAMAAEIGTMKVTEQIDALQCLGANPIHYLVVPRVLACVVLIPLLTIIADFMGIIGGALVSIKIHHIDAYHYWKHSRAFIGNWEVFTGLFKSVFFGGEIAIVSCYRGFKSAGGAEGVGRAATLAFVVSFIVILATDFFLGVFLNGLYDFLWPGVKRSLGN
jgi:phospholipid/cholesterol/gamma-HCH transport system permease protein